MRDRPYLAAAMLQRRNHATYRPLHLAVGEGGARSVQCILIIAPETAAYPDYRGWTPLNICIDRLTSLPNCPALPILRLLLDSSRSAKGAGTASHRRISYGNYPLHDLAIKACNETALRWLYDAFPAALQAPNFFGHTPMHLAARHCSEVAMTHLVTVWPEGVKQLNNRGLAPIHVAVQHGNEESFRALLHADVTTALLRTGHGETTAHVAIFYHRFDMLSAMLQMDPATVRVRGSTTGNTLFHTCARVGDLNILKLLLSRWREGLMERTADRASPMDVSDGEGLRLIQRTVWTNDVSLFVTLSTAYPGCVSDFSLFFFALKSRGPEMLRILRPQFEDLLCQSTQALYEMTWNIRRLPTVLTEVVRLISTTADASHRMELLQRVRVINGDTLVHTAVRERQRDLLKTLLQMWPDAVRVENDHQETPFDVTYDFCDVRVLFQYGSARRCPVPTDKERASRTVTRRAKIDAVGVLVDTTSNVEQRRAAGAVLRMPSAPGQYDFHISKRMWRKIGHAQQRSGDAASGKQWCHLSPSVS